MRQFGLLIALFCLPALWLLFSSRGRADPQQQVQQAYGPGYDAHLDYLKQAVSELRAIRAMMEVQQPGSAAKRAGAESIIVARCARCHQESVAEEKGDGFVLVLSSGKLAALSSGDRKHMRRKLTAGAMPPGAPLPTTEKKTVLDHLETLEKEKR